MKKLLITLGVLLVIGGLWWYTQALPTPTEVVTVEIPVPPLADTTSVDTSNWLTYTNTKYGYSLKYPLNLIPEDGGIGIEEVNETGSVIFVNSEVPGWRNDIVFGVEVRNVTEPVFVRIQKFLDEERGQKRLTNETLSTGETLVRRGITPITEVYKIDGVFPVYQYMISFYFEDASGEEEKTNTWGPFTAFDHEQQGFAVSFRNENVTAVAMLKSMTFR